MRGRRGFSANSPGGSRQRAALVVARTTPCHSRIRRRVNRRIRYRGLRALTGFALALFSLFTALQAQAQTPSSLTREQLEAHANLPRDRATVVLAPANADRGANFVGFVPATPLSLASGLGLWSARC
jgi:hypothetical protein